MSRRHKSKRVLSWSQKFIYLFTAILTFAAIFLSLSLNAEPATAQFGDAQCLASYMNAVINGTTGTTHVRLLSPAFNMDNDRGAAIARSMAAAGARFKDVEAIAGNAYDRNGRPVTTIVGTFLANAGLAGHKVFITETGDFDGTGLGVLSSEFSKIRSSNQYVGALLFNAFGGNPQFSRFQMTDGDISTACGGSCGKIGINSASFYGAQLGSNYYSRASSLGMRFSIEIYRDDVGTALNTLKATHSAGMTPVIRIGVGNDSGGFDNPDDYVKFLKELDKNVDFDFYAIAGPNEPQSEKWAENPNCAGSGDFGPPNTNFTAAPPAESGNGPFPNAYVPCSETRDNEFNSLRPYQASPCAEPPGTEPKQPQALYCGNDLIIRQIYQKHPSDDCEDIEGGLVRCKYKETQNVDVAINLSEAELPIAGNTESVPNVASNANGFTDVQLVNQYLNYYLRGRIDLAESLAPSIKTEDLTRILNFAGPLNKLLPQRVQQNKREETIKEAIDSKGGAEIRHDQVVGCTLSNLSGIVGNKIQYPCASNDQLDINRLVSELLGDGIGQLKTIVPEKMRLSQWQDNTPPKVENFEKVTDWWKKYTEWEGNNCTPNVNIGGKDFYICINADGKPNFFASLFPYIPYSTTEDKKGSVELVADPFQEGEKPGLVPQPETATSKITSMNFTPQVDKKLVYFPHMAENAELSELLQNTYSPQGAKTYSGQSGDGPPYPTGRCEILNARFNKGDDLFGEWNLEGADISGSMEYTTEFSCDFKGPRNAPDFFNQICEKPVDVAAGSVYTRTPQGQEVWERTVFGDFSIFKHLFPKTGPGTPVDTILDIPAVTGADYSATGANVSALAGDPGNSRPGSDAQIGIPHLGSVSEYFQKGIQTALLPQGMGPGINTSATNNFNNNGGFGGLINWAVNGGSGGNGNFVQGGSCQVTEGNEPYCSVGFLQQYFGSDWARTASRICNAESGGGDPNALNKKCPDYSVGLFQINLIWHYVIVPDKVNGVPQPDAGKRLNCYDGFSPARSCNISDQALLDRCTQILLDPVVNIKKAVELRRARGGWGDWSTYNGIAACRQP